MTKNDKRGLILILTLAILSGIATAGYLAAKGTPIW